MIIAAHEAGRLNDIRVILGNDDAVEASRNGRRPFPDGTMFVRIAWKLEPSDRNNAFFGQNQSFVAGAPTIVQFELKDAKKYAATGGWGYAQLQNGTEISSTSLSRTCGACHSRLECHDISGATQLARIHRQLLVERVKSYTVPRRPSEAFIAEGHIGLIRAICRFEPDGTEDFPAFAIRHVDAALRDYAEFLLGERVRRPSMVSESTGRRPPIS